MLFRRLHLSRPQPGERAGAVFHGADDYDAFLELMAESSVRTHAHPGLSPDHRETTDGHRKEMRKFLQSILDSVFSVVISFSKQKSTANAARHAVVPSRERRIDQLGSSDRHRRSPGGRTITVRNQGVSA